MCMPRRMHTCTHPHSHPPSHTPNTHTPNTHLTWWLLYAWTAHPSALRTAARVLTHNTHTYTHTHPHPHTHTQQRALVCWVLYAWTAHPSALRTAVPVLTHNTHIHTHSPTPTHPHTTTCSHLVGAVRLDSAPLSSAYCDTSSGLAIWNCTWKCARSHTHTHVVTVNCAEWLKESA